MASRKKKKKEEEELLAPDAFLESATQGASWFEKNFKLVVGGIVVALAGVLGLQVLNQQKARTAAAMTSDLNDAIEVYREATGLQKVLTSTSPESLAKDYKEAYDEFAAIRTQHPNTGVARMASLYQADLARRLEKHDEALPMYEEYLAKATPKDPLTFFALEGAGYSLESSGKLDEALAKFQELAKTQEFYKDYALKHQARVLERKGDAPAAIAAYQAIVDMDPASPLKSFAENRLKALQ